MTTEPNLIELVILLLIPVIGLTILWFGKKK